VKLVLHNGPPLYPERVATGSERFKLSPDASVKRKIWAAAFMTAVNVNVIVGPAEGITVTVRSMCCVSTSPVAGSMATVPPSVVLQTKLPPRQDGEPNDPEASKVTLSADAVRLDPASKLAHANARARKDLMSAHLPISGSVKRGRRGVTAA
jgi:hypothetical protein